MPRRSLDDVVRSVDNLAGKFRRDDVTRGNLHWEVYREEHTNWIEEQRAWRETCILMDQSYHLANYYVEGPDALAANADLGVKDFTAMDPEAAPQARQHPVCNSDGYVVGDPILFHLGEGEVVVTGNRGLAQKWIQYNVETGDYDATVTDVYSPYADAPPVDFRFEIQGPNARAVVDEVIDGPVPDVGFFGMDTLTIRGVDCYVLGHGMASVPGYEIFGPYEHHDEFKSLFMEAGADRGIRELGAKAYKTATVTSGWLPPGLPAVYEHEAMAGYREWLDDSCVEANWSLGGSFESDDVTDYYVDLIELGYERIIDLDHDFPARDALAAKAADPGRTKVTLVWDADDVVDVFASLFGDGPRHKFMELPDVFQQWDLGHYDRVEVDGELVGVSMFTGYDANQRELLSLGVVDVDHAEPGAEATLVWGEPNSKKAAVERHVEKEIGVTVAPAPYVRGREDL